MIRTLIEVTADTDGDHRRQLEATLGKLGYEPKRSEEYGRDMAYLFEELRERGLDPGKLIAGRRARILAQQDQGA